MLRNNLMLPTEALDIPEAIDFDGTNDYLSRSSDLVGNADGKTFTFSAWVWWNGNALTSYIYANEGNYFTVFHNLAGTVTIRGRNTSGTDVLDVTFPSGTLNKNAFTSIIISCDLSNSANRNASVNDIVVTPTWTTYTNSNIDFSRTGHAVGATTAAGSKIQGRLAHVFLDYTYRDLSVEANRRLFITADRKPAANQQALNPILYLPLNDPTQPGKNLGTGGDFNLTGVVARSGRGPNQYNAPYSDLNGSTQYLSRTSLTGIADGKQVTLAFCSYGAINYTFSLGSSGSFNRFRVLIVSTQVYVRGWNSAGTTILDLYGNIQSGYDLTSRNAVVVISLDLSDTGKRFVYVNGSATTLTVSTYTNDNIDFTTANYFVGRDVASGTNASAGRLGNVFFDTKYIDLSVPTNLAKFVTGTGIDAKPVDLGANGEKPFGTAPLIYLPMYGNNAGKNYGTGGDFTVNSGPFPGARGPNEFWGNKASSFETGYIQRSAALVGVSASKTASVVFTFYPRQINDVKIILSGGLTVKFTGNNLIISSGSILSVVNTAALSVNTAYTVFLSFDMNDTSRRYLSVNQVAGNSWNTYVNSQIPFNNYTAWRLFYDGNVGNFDGWVSEFYFTTDYIDFSQEANRLKFRDAFGNPVALQPQIEAGTLPNPAIYMRFDPANFGKNSGTGGDFTVSGTITDGGQI